MSFYDSYVRLCNSIGKTPSAVAVEIGIEKSTVSRWKDGGSPSDATKAKVADYFNIPVNYLDSDDVMILSAKQQADLFSLLDLTCSGKGITPAFVVSQTGVPNIFARLKNNSYRRAHRNDIFKVAKFLGIEDEVKNFFSFDHSETSIQRLTREEKCLLSAFQSMAPERRDYYLTLLLNDITCDEFRFLKFYRLADEIDRTTIRNILSRYEEEGAASSAG